MTSTDLEAVVARTRHERFRWLVSDENPDAAQRESYRNLVARLAKGDAPAAPVRQLIPLSTTLHAQKHGSRNCWFSYKDSACGCSGLKCHLHKRVVQIGDCVECLKRW